MQDMQYRNRLYAPNAKLYVKHLSIDN